jgi:predicted RecB family nuclease
MTLNEQANPNNEPLILTPSHFFKYSIQPAWIWYDQFGDLSKKEEISEFTLRLMEQGVLHEEDYISSLEVSKVEAIEAEKAFKATLQLMQQGARLIYQGCLQIERNGVIYRGRPDLLKRRETPSNWGAWSYAPIEIKWSSNIKSTHKHQLAFYAILLESVQGLLPKEVTVINHQHESLSLELDEEDIAKTKSLIGQIIAVMRGDKPALTITSKSKSSPWFKVALEEAEQKQDIALVYRLDSRSLDTLRKLGIRTIQDLAFANVATLPKIPHASQAILKKAQLQARSLISNEVIVANPIERLPNPDLKLYFDIEGDPLLDLDYLLGVWVSGDEQHLYAQAENVRFYERGKYFIYFLARRPEEEEAMWQAFLTWISCLPEEYVVCHYANYEKAHLRSLEAEYGGSRALKTFQKRLIDLQKVIDKSIVFPLYFYSIKDIAKSRFLNFQWRHQKAGGGQSVFWYEEWLATGNPVILEDIVNYNEDDVRATEHLCQWLSTF